MPPKRKGEHFKTCRRCSCNFYGNKYSKICPDCNKTPRTNNKYNSEEKIKRKLNDLFEDQIEWK